MPRACGRSRSTTVTFRASSRRSTSGRANGSRTNLSPAGGSAPSSGWIPSTAAGTPRSGPVCCRHHRGEAPRHNVIDHSIPLIRYELADEPTVLTEPNPDPWTGRSSADIEGRVEGTFVYVGDVEIHLHLFRSPLGRRRQMLEYLPAGPGLVPQADLPVWAVRDQVVPLLARQVAAGGATGEALPGPYVGRPFERVSRGARSAAGHSARTSVAGMSPGYGPNGLPRRLRVRRSQTLTALSAAPTARLRPSGENVEVGDVAGRRLDGRSGRLAAAGVEEQDLAVLRGDAYQLRVRGDVDRRRVVAGAATEELPAAARVPRDHRRPARAAAERDQLPAVGAEVKSAEAVPHGVALQHPAAWQI